MIIDAGDALFCLTTDGDLIVINKSSDGFEPIAQYTVADSPTWAPPVILGKHILIKDETTLALWSME